MILLCFVSSFYQRLQQNPENGTVLCPPREYGNIYGSKRSAKARRIQVSPEVFIPDKLRRVWSHSDEVLPSILGLRSLTPHNTDQTKTKTKSKLKSPVLRFRNVFGFPCHKVSTFVVSCIAFCIFRVRVRVAHHSFKFLPYNGPRTLL